MAHCKRREGGREGEGDGGRERGEREGERGGGRGRGRERGNEGKRRGHGYHLYILIRGGGKRLYGMSTLTETQRVEEIERATVSTNEREERRVIAKQVHVQYSSRGT